MNAVREAFEQIQAQAASEFAAHAVTLEEHREELERVMGFFGIQQAMDFAWSELEIPSLAFLMEFELMAQGERLGVFAL